MGMNEELKYRVVELDQELKSQGILRRIRDGESKEATERMRDLDNENTELLESNKNNLEQIYDLKEKIISNERLQAEFHE